MNETASIAARSTRLTSDPEVSRPRHWLGGVARRILLAKLRGIVGGSVRVIEGFLGDEHREWVFGNVTSGGSDGEALPTITLRIERRDFYSKAVFGGSVGAGESYMAGDWTCDDLTSLVRLLVRNRRLLQGVDNGWAKLTAPLRQGFHRLRRNTRQGSRRNIEAHYDLSNSFFKLFLDRQMMYSCAIFETPEMDLHQASEAKLERICRKLELGPEDHLLEIGTGWGGLAIYAARRFGCRVTTTTISPSQAEFARQRVRENDLEDRVEILMQDYRDLRGRYDKLVSIEMIEAVGLEHLETYFRCCNALLKPDGVMLLQAITIDDRLYGEARRSVDFIQRYIFPGSGIPSLAAMSDSWKAATQLTPIHLEDIGLHYATTLRHWRQRFAAQLDAVRQLGFSERFLRMWDFYLCYCEGGFLERSISDVQVLLAGPQYRRAAPLGELGSGDP